MFFDNVKLYLEDANTGKLKIKFICKECGKEMDKAENWECPCSMSGNALYHKTEFMCNECKSRLKDSL